jgi:hypothetical protein
MLKYKLKISWKLFRQSAVTTPYPLDVRIAAAIRALLKADSKIGEALRRHQRRRLNRGRGIGSRG